MEHAHGLQVQVHAHAHATLSCSCASCACACACALRAQVLRLVGRTLAKVLILGDGYHVSDRLPSFVLQVGLGLGVGVGC